MVFECVPENACCCSVRRFRYYLYLSIGLNVVRFRNYLVCYRVFHTCVKEKYPARRGSLFAVFAFHSPVYIVKKYPLPAGQVDVELFQ